MFDRCQLQIAIIDDSQKTRLAIDIVFLLIPAEITPFTA